MVLDLSSHTLLKEQKLGKEGEAYKLLCFNLSSVGIEFQSLIDKIEFTSQSTMKSLKWILNGLPCGFRLWSS